MMIQDSTSYILIQDVNDNSPVFLQSEYTFHVNESEGGKFLCVRVRALRLNDYY